MMWIVCEILADLLLSIFVMENVTADHKEKKEMKNEPMGKRKKTGDCGMLYLECLVI
jgi:hypothetical protein